MNPQEKLHAAIKFNTSGIATGYQPDGDGQLVQVFVAAEAALNPERPDYEFFADSPDSFKQFTGYQDAVFNVPALIWVPSDYKWHTSTISAANGCMLQTYILRKFNGTLWRISKGWYVYQLEAGYTLGD